MASYDWNDSREVGGSPVDMNAVSQANLPD